MPFILRPIKIGMITALAFFFTLIAINNCIAPEFNQPYVKHVLAMDTIPNNPVVDHRAIKNSHLQKIIFYLITSSQILAGVCCWIGSIQLLRHLYAPQESFNQAKSIALFGLFIGFCLYLIGFITIGGEWFFMWQSPSWNGQNTAGLFLNFILLTMIFVAMPF